MAELNVDRDEIIVALSRWEKIGAVRLHDLRFPRSAVRDAREVDRPFAEIRGLHIPGTSVPRVVALGTWRDRGARDFLAIYRGRPGVVVDLDPTQAEFERVICSTEDPAGLVATLRG